MHMPIQFDTLDYAKRLASAGVPVQQAEAHAAALGDVLGSAVVVHGELAALERNLLGEIKLVAQRVDTRVGALDVKIDALELKLDSKIDTLELKLDSRIDALELKLDSRIDVLEQKFDARFDNSEQKFNARFATSEQKFDARLERLDLRQGADMKHVYWMMSTLILLNLGILSKLMLQ
jgi:Skp family chaperone for outer membrane proteins